MTPLCIVHPRLLGIGAVQFAILRLLTLPMHWNRLPIKSWGWTTPNASVLYWVCCRNYLGACGDAGLLFYNDVSVGRWAVPSGAHSLPACWASTTQWVTVIRGGGHRQIDCLSGSLQGRKKPRARFKKPQCLYARSATWGEFRPVGPGEHSP